MTDERTTAARQMLDELTSTLGTLQKMINDIEPPLCLPTDLARLESARDYLNDAEDLLAEICANNVEMQELDDAGPLFPFEAWDIVAAQPVTVTGWFNSARYRLSTGETALPSEITTVFPAWYVRAKQALVEGVQ